MFLTEYPALTLPIVNGIIDNKTTPTERQRLQAKTSRIKFKITTSLIFTDGYRDKLKRMNTSKKNFFKNDLTYI